MIIHETQNEETTLNLQPAKFTCWLIDKQSDEEQIKRQIKIFTTIFVIIDLTIGELLIRRALVVWLVVTKLKIMCGKAVMVLRGCYKLSEYQD